MELMLKNFVKECCWRTFYHPINLRKEYFRYFKYLWLKVMIKYLEKIIPDTVKQFGNLLSLIFLSQQSGIYKASILVQQNKSTWDNLDQHQNLSHEIPQLSYNMVMQFGMNRYIIVLSMLSKYLLQIPMQLIKKSQ